jgi:hypothetical protein
MVCVTAARRIKCAAAPPSLRRGRGAGGVVCSPVSSAGGRSVLGLGCQGGGDNQALDLLNFRSAGATTVLPPTPCVDLEVSTGVFSPALVVPTTAATAFGRCSLPVQGSWSEVADPVILLRFRRTEQPELEPTSMGMNPGRRATGAMALPFAAGFLFDSKSLSISGDGAPSARGIDFSCAFLRRRLGVRGGRPWAMVLVCTGTPRGFFVFFLSLGSFVRMYWDTCSLSYLRVISACVTCTCSFVG